MNKGLAAIIRDRMLDIPFIELFGGIVYTQVKQERIYSSEDDAVGKYIEHKFPVSCDYAGKVDCQHKGLKDFVPDSKLKGIMYFEDNGVESLGFDGRAIKYRSNIRMIVWLNTSFVDLSSCSSLTTPVMNGILERLVGKNPFNLRDFQKIDVNIKSIPPVNASIFSKYSYPEATTQYLMPPYEYFAIDLEILFSVNPMCINYVQAKIPDPCTQ